MKKVVVLIIVIVIFSALALSWWNGGLAPANKNEKTTQSFIVPKGAGLRQISNDLKEQGLVRDATVFFLRVKQKGIDKKIQAGNFSLSPSMSTDEIATMLTKGVLDIWVTVPEGMRADEIADTLSKSIPTYDETWRTQLQENEGYLFPDTYLIPKDADIDQVITIMRGNFDEKYKTLDLSQTDLSKEELVTLASMIEREAKYDEDRPIISSVMHNRLGLGMALQIDATIQYAKGKVGNNWWAPVRVSEYQSVQSDYNTYLAPGLPPGPIANPGIEALQAAATPDNTDYIYYITDQNGINRYAETLDEHNANIERFGL